jgi:diguanylate cyclase (GGDEF)-like protein
VPLPAISDARSVQGRLGAGFCALVGLFLVGTTTGVLRLDHRDLVLCGVVGGVLIALSAGLALLPWERMPRGALLVNPAIITIALSVLGALHDAVAQALLSVITLSVVYIGLTQPPKITSVALPFLIVDWWLAYPSHPSAIVVRLPLAVVVWFLVGEVIAHAAHKSREEASALRSSAHTDPLTQLGNRRELTDQLARLPVAGLVMFLDLDHFKVFNDRYGHSAGDTVLVDFAAVVKRTLREGDLVSRFGGEEFVVLLPESVRSDEVYERIRSAWRSAGAPVTFSAGVAQRAEGESPDDTMRRADEALYRAKSGGRDRLVLDVLCIGSTSRPTSDGLKSAADVLDADMVVDLSRQH